MMDLSDGFQRLLNIGQDVADIFDAHRKADEAGIYARILQLRICELAMCGAGGMQNAGARIGHMGDHKQDRT